MDLSIIIVSWNVREKLKDCLEAIYDSYGEFEFEVFVIDNNSHDESAKMIEDNFNEVNLIKNDKNVGLSKAINQVKNKAGGNFVLLLNPDNVVMKDTLVNMIGWMKDNPNASVAGCKLVSEEGEVVKQARKFPTVWNQLAIILKLPHLFPAILDNYIIKDFDYSKPAQVDSIRGAFFMIRKDMIERIGLWDTRYFLWFEEVDYCRLVYQNGGEVWYTPAAKCIDHVGQSFEQVGSLQKQKYFKDSMLKYFKRWHPSWQYWLLRIAWVFGISISWIGESCKIKAKNKT